jgi:hypothetical protein
VRQQLVQGVGEPPFDEGPLTVVAPR